MSFIAKDSGCFVGMSCLHLFIVFHAEASKMSYELRYKWNMPVIKSGVEILLQSLWKLT